jgi:hypothetical protein
MNSYSRKIIYECAYNNKRKKLNPPEAIKHITADKKKIDTEFVRKHPVE